mgnify:CR=1 FL=1
MVFALFGEKLNGAKKASGMLRGSFSLYSRPGNRPFLRPAHELAGKRPWISSTGISRRIENSEPRALVKCSYCSMAFQNSNSGKNGSEEPDYGSGQKPAEPTENLHSSDDALQPAHTLTLNERQQKAAAQTGVIFSLGLLLSACSSAVVKRDICPSRRLMSSGVRRPILPYSRHFKWKRTGWHH